MSENSCSSCSKSDCSYSKPVQNENDEQFQQRQRIGRALCKIKNVYLVLSGKGGVGKSTVSTNLAISLANAGYKTGLLDIDLHGPSIPTMLGLASHKAMNHNGMLLPAEPADYLKVMSMGFLLDSPDQPVVWRGPMKAGAIQQLISDVEWGELDYLIVDCPPGTGDEPLSIAQTIPDAKGAIIVTTPQDVAIADVKRSITFCSMLNLPITGIVENMSGFICPDCGKEINLFKKDGGYHLATANNLEFLGKIPIDPSMVEASDSGKSYINSFEESKANDSFKSIANKLIKNSPKEVELNA